VHACSELQASHTWLHVAQTPVASTATIHGDYKPVVATMVVRAPNLLVVCVKDAILSKLCCMNWPLALDAAVLASAVAGCNDFFFGGATSG